MIATVSMAEAGFITVTVLLVLLLIYAFVRLTALAAFRSWSDVFGKHNKKEGE